MCIKSVHPRSSFKLETDRFSALFLLLISFSMVKKKINFISLRSLSKQVLLDHQ